MMMRQRRSDGWSRVSAEDASWIFIYFLTFNPFTVSSICVVSRSHRTLSRKQTYRKVKKKLNSSIKRGCLSFDFFLLNSRLSLELTFSIFVVIASRVSRAEQRVEFVGTVLTTAENSHVGKISDNIFFRIVPLTPWQTKHYHSVSCVHLSGKDQEVCRCRPQAKSLKRNTLLFRRCKLNSQLNAERVF